MRNSWFTALLVVAAAIFGCTSQRLSTGSPSSSTLVQSGVGFYQDVSWSPDGTALAVSILEETDTPEGFRYRVHLLKVDPPELVPLTPGPMDLWTSWSPDGNQIAYASRSGGNSDIFVIRADGSGRKQLTDGPADETQPNWSPDGSRIAYISNSGGRENVWIMYRDGSGQKPIGTTDGDAQNPVWSPDQSHIAYYETDSTGKDLIFVMKADGSERRPLTEGLWPHWAPDMSTVLFGGSRGLCTINIDGTGELSIVPAVEFGVFSPDGGRIAYIASDGGTVSVRLMNRDGSRSVRLLERQAPAW